jgi:hypothetical protein
LARSSYGKIGGIYFLLYASRKKWFVVERSRFAVVAVLLRNSFLMDEQNTNEKDAVESRRTAKKLYQDPVFRYEKVFETMALSCGKVNATEFQCRFHRQSS